jgi:hypothetical protein
LGDPAFRPCNGRDSGRWPHLESVEDDLGRLAHEPTSQGHVFPDAVDRGAEQYGVVDGAAHLKPGFDHEAAGEPQHFRAVGLHQKVRQRSVSGVLIDMDDPSQSRDQIAMEDGKMDRAFGPFPELSIGLTVHAQKVLGMCS